MSRQCLLFWKQCSTLIYSWRGKLLAGMRDCMPANNQGEGEKSVIILVSRSSSRKTAGFVPARVFLIKKYVSRYQPTDHAKCNQSGNQNRFLQGFEQVQRLALRHHV